MRLGARNYDLLGRLNGKATAIIPVYLRSGANALDVREAIAHRLEELQKQFPPGVTADIVYDTTPFVEASIEEVVHTLVEAMVLVFLVVFIFLQSWRATLIPVLAVPVSIIGTFVGMQMFGFSINTLTLFGLVLAIGIVVDDAIVVVENVERIMAERHVSPAQATDEAMAEVSGALIAIVLVLCAVFVPVAFMGGLTGRLYKQFALTIAISVIISGIVALTLTPALCAVLLKPHVPGHKKWAPFEWFNRTFDRITGGYAGREGGTRRAEDDARHVRRHGGALARALQPRADGLPPVGRQGLLRRLRLAARRGVAAAHRQGGAAGRGSAPERPGRRERRDPRGPRLHFQREPDQHRHDVHHPQAVG